MKFFFPVLLSLAAPLALHAQEISLFNGRDLTGWKGLPGYWSVKDGAITGQVTPRNTGGKGNTFLVWQGGDVGDFELNLKFKLQADNPEGMANSGVQFRAYFDDAEKISLKGYQAELDPGTLKVPWASTASLCGALTDDPPGTLLALPGQRARALPGYEGKNRMKGAAVVEGSLGTEQSAPASYRKNDWNDCRIIATGNRIRIFINGLPTVDVTDETSRFVKGSLGLQLHNLAKPKTLQFRDIKLRPATVLPTLASGSGMTLPAVPAVSTIHTDSRQTRIDVLKDQAPNAVEWALSPLDQPVPPDIRQNLTYLREDLLDEGSKAAATRASAYPLGSQLCDKLLLAIEERSQTRAKAGYAAAQADADVRVTNQTLDARRNYLMSWPQFHREESQRAALDRKERSGADLKKQRTDLEWAARTEVLRKYLDELYRQFRGALR